MLTLTEDEARNRLADLAAAPPRRPYLLGLAGAPGVGKSTFAESLRLPLLPMDGYHYANEHLDRLGLRDRKGAPATFDVDGFAATLGRLRAGDSVVAPRFDRTLDAAIAGAIPLDADSAVIVTEGNYLLHDRDGWEHVRALLDEVWYLDVADDVRTRRLIERHRRYGRSLEDATRWAAEVDQPNAALITATRHRADAIITLT